MIHIREYMMLIFSLFGAISVAQNLPICQQLDSGWTFKSENDSVWLEARVPGCVHADLIANQRINDPFIGNNEQSVQWVSETNWEYQTTFVLTSEQLEKSHIELNFEGLDTYASIFLNGRLILIAENAFRSYQVNIKEFAKSHNTLLIRFQSPDNPEAKSAQNLPYSLPGGTRVFTRKAQFQYGWDWGPELNTCGIWRPVTIVAWDSFRLKDLYVAQNEVTEEKAILELQIFQNSTIRGIVTYEVSINDSLYGTFQNTPGNGPTKIPVAILNPDRWWPHNIGSPHMYSFKIRAFDQNGLLLDQIETLTGLRTIELVTTQNNDSSSFFFKINGVPVYAKGANYIPQHSFQPLVTQQDYAQVLDDAVQANMNMLRVWGGGIYEDDTFYEEASKKGVMIWQDFMFACAMYPGDSTFLKNVEAEAIENVVRLRNHPCLVLWCGNNENAEGWHRWGWSTGRSESEKAKIWSDYLTIFDTLLPRIVSDYSNLPYHESSPVFGRGNPKYLFNGDAHDWWVWHDGYPFEHFEQSVPRFMSEFGFQSFPDIRTVSYMQPIGTLSLESQAVKNHQKHHSGFETIHTYMARDYEVTDDPGDYIYVSQLVQAHGIIKGIEAQRRAKPYCMGSLYWQLNDCWPAISWSSIDFFGHWKALHFKAKKAFNNLLISAKISPESVSIYIVNDSLAPLEDQLHLSLLNFDGQFVWDTSAIVHVLPNASQKVFDLDLTRIDFDPISTVLSATFKNQTRLMYFLPPRKLALKNDEIKTTITKKPFGFSIELRSTTLQKDVRISSDSEGHFSDNFFDLLPDKPLKIDFHTKTLSHPNLTFQSVNSVHARIHRD